MTTNFTLRVSSTGEAPSVIINEGGTVDLEPINQHLTILDNEVSNLVLKTDALELKTDALELKTDTLELKTDALELKTNALELKTNALELKITTEIKERKDADIELYNMITVYGPFLYEIPFTHGININSGIILVLYRYFNIVSVKIPLFGTNTLHNTSVIGTNNTSIQVDTKYNKSGGINLNNAIIYYNESKLDDYTHGIFTMTIDNLNNINVEIKSELGKKFPDYVAFPDTVFTYVLY